MVSNGARVIFKSSFLNPSKNSSGGSGTYAEYIGTREGAVKISESTKGLPVTDSQKEFIDEILRKYPEEKTSIAFHEFERMQTIGNASAFITDAVDKHGNELRSLDGYAQYMATRPGVVKIHDTGLFSDGPDEVSLDKVKNELSNYKGNVYLPIISLRPEDSIGLGYDNPDAWHELVERHRDDFAKEYHIQPENLKWIGAFHHATNKDGIIHNHIHMMIWSKNPNEGWQTKDTAVNLKRVLANDIFQNERLDILQTSSKTRDQIKEEAIDNIISISEKIKIEGLGENTNQKNLINKELLVLSEKLKDYKGRQYYGYMKPEVKQMIDNIMDDLFEENSSLKEMYSQWSNAKDAQVQIYKMDHYEPIPPSQNKEFNKIKTEIIKEAIKLGKENDIHLYKEMEKDILDGTAENLIERATSDNVTEEDIAELINGERENHGKSEKRRYSEAWMKEQAVLLKGKYKEYTAEECGGDPERAMLLTKIAIQKVWKKENLHKSISRVKKDIENGKSISEKNKKLTKKQKEILSDYKKIKGKNFYYSNKTYNSASQATATLLSGSIAKLIASIGSGMSHGGGHHGKSQKLAVEFDEEEYLKKIALGMKM